MDVRFLLSLSLPLSIQFARPVAFFSASVKSRRRNDANDTHTLTVSHTRRTVSMSPPEIRYGTEVQGTASTNRTKKCAANLSGRNGTAKAAAERAQCFTAPTAAAAARAALFLSLETPIRHFMRDLEPRGVALDVPGPPPRPRVRLRWSVGPPLWVRTQLQDVEAKLRRGWTEDYTLRTTRYTRPQPTVPLATPSRPPMPARRPTAPPSLSSSRSQRAGGPGGCFQGQPVLGRRGRQGSPECYVRGAGAET